MYGIALVLRNKSSNILAGDSLFLASRAGSLFFFSGVLEPNNAIKQYPISHFKHPLDELNCQTYESFPSYQLEHPGRSQLKVENACDFLAHHCSLCAQ